MTEGDSSTLILGMGVITDAVGFEYKPILCWDREKGDNGYHSIRWETTGVGFTIREKNYIWRTAHEEQAGVILDELVQRSPAHWFWAKDPIPLFPGAHGFYMQQDLATLLRSSLSRDIFSGLTRSEELYGRNVTLGFGTVEVIKSRQSEWYGGLERAADARLRDYLTSGREEEKTRRIVDTLRLLHCTEQQAEQANLRFLLTLQLTDQQFGRVHHLMAGNYEMYDRTGEVRRTADGRNIIVPNAKLFANPVKVRTALEELRSSLTGQ